jgi:interferon-induced GTP-binding protein Mx
MMDDDNENQPQERNYTDNSTLSSTFEGECKALLNLADEFRSLGLHQEGFSFPSIVVVGDQSSGKSTLLEAISGVNLPKSDGLTTRCPLIISLRGTDEPIWKGNISYYQLQSGEQIEKRISTRGDVCKAIEEATESALGPGSCISPEPMALSITAHGLPNLTLVDMPGIIHVAERDQSEDILNTIRDMVKRFIAPENVIILVVMSAVRDIGTNIAIQYAKDVDPTASRTIGVITKCDAVTTEQYKLVETINSNRYHISQVYFVAHLNRMREPVHRRANAAQMELEYLKNQPGFMSVDHTKLGIENLTKLLVRRLATSIKSELRKVNDSLHRKHDEVNELLKDLAPPPETDRNSLQKHLMTNFSSLIRQLREVFETGFQGNPINSDENEQSLYGMWIDSYDELENNLITNMEAMFAKGEFSSDKLENYLRRNPVRTPRGFGNNPTFQQCVEDYVPSIESYVLNCLLKNKDVLATYLNEFLQKYTETFPSPVLMEYIKKTFDTTFLICYNEATKSMKEYLTAERAKTKLNYWMPKRKAGAQQENVVDSCFNVLKDSLINLSVSEDVVQTAIATALPIVGNLTKNVFDSSNQPSGTIENSLSETEIFRRELAAYLQAVNTRVHTRVMDSIAIQMHGLFLTTIEQKLIAMSLESYIVDLTRIEDVHQERREQLESTFRRVRKGMENFEKLKL